jgi:isopenicillin N synthase-like dioxygenase
MVDSGSGKVPVVDLGPTRSTDPAEVRRLAMALGDVCRDIGFFYVANHGISPAVLDRAESLIYRFFEMPEQDKRDIHISKSPYHRGYFPYHEENALHSPDVTDLKEGFDMALELSADDPDVIAGKPFHGPNAWPPALPEFRPAMLDLYGEFRRTCAQISSLFAIALGLPSDFFVDRTDKPLCQMRAVKYPPQVQADGESIGCGEHTDYGIVSMIWQIDVGGLEVQTTSGEWINAPRIPGTFVCPMGDMTQVWTNDHWKATVHRVINSSTTFRHAAAFFFDPNYDCVVQPLEQFVNAQHPARYEPTTMGAHVHRGFDGTFAYRATADA